MSKDGAGLEILLDGPHSAAWNMAVDETLLNARGAWFRVYRWWPRTLSLGYFQRAQDFARERAQIPWVRRPTGGGAILHDNEWTLSLALENTSLGRDIEASYGPLHDALRSTLEDLKVPLGLPKPSKNPSNHARPNTPWCFDDPIPMDLLSKEGHKVFGSAQRRRGNRVLHHGSLILSPPRENPGAGFRRSFPSQALPALLACKIAKHLGRTPYFHHGLPREYCAQAEDLARHKYSRPSWNQKR